MKSHKLCVYLFLAILNVDASHKHFILPKEVNPLEYDISIRPNLTLGVYKGKVIITVNVTKNIDSITLHSKNLKINYAKINTVRANIQEDTECDFITLKKHTDIKKGIYNITINFEGDMKNKTYGFYRGYEIEYDREVYFGATFLEPTNARTAFPCFDEPQLKAKFSIHILRPLHYVALSNMDQIGETLEPHRRVNIHFRQTPPIPPHLVTFFVGKYAFVEDYYVKKNNKTVIPTRIYTPLSNMGNMEFAAHEIPKLLKWFVKYTGYDYMFPKLDYITINSKFHIGGMEHWGATTTREESIRYNETMSILDTRSAKTIAHELAHIWFGNLVTVASWGEFWLTEGFVRFMDIKVNDLYKEQNEKISLSSSILHTALWRDDDVTALPLVRKIKNPIDVYDILDNINSNKGGSILRMTEQVIGEKLMQKVVHTYLTNNKYGSITSKHFIQVLQSFVTFNATDFLDGFLKQSGFPMIVAKLNKDAQSVTLIKERFLRFGQPHAEGSWTVPIWYITNIDRKPKFVWFPSNKTRMNLKLDKKISWIKLNYQQGSYYRTHYCYEMWHKLIGVIQDLTVEDRINLLDDAGAILRSGKLPCSLTLRATKYLYNENRVEVWETAQDIFGKIRIGFLQNNMSIENLNLYIADLIDRQYKKYSWTSAKNETFATKAARATIFNLACYYGHEGCRRMVMKLWPKRETLSVDIKNILLANNPYRKINYSRTNVKNIQELGVWFGADFSKLSPEPVFHWPKGIMQNCEKWLKNRPNFHIV